MDTLPSTPASRHGVIMQEDGKYYTLYCLSNTGPEEFALLEKYSSEDSAVSRAAHVAKAIGFTIEVRYTGEEDARYTAFPD